MMHSMFERAGSDCSVLRSRPHYPTTNLTTPPILTTPLTSLPHQDLTALCREAALVPIRELGDRIQHIASHEVRPIGVEDFHVALHVIRTSVSKDMLDGYRQWNKEFGSTG